MENGVTEKPLEDYKRMFSEARDLTSDARTASQIDDDYYHSYQLTQEERAVLNKRGQPDTVFNRYRKAINGTLGVLKNGATDPRAYGRTPRDDDGAEVVSKVLRFAADINDFDNMRVRCAYQYLVPGTCAVLIEVDDERRPLLTEVNWEELFYDPRSRKADFSDARYMGIAKWMYADDVIRDYPHAKEDIEGALEGSDSAGLQVHDTMEDRPRDASSNWLDRKRRRVLVVEIYHREGADWHRCVFHGNGVLEKDKSPYVDAKGKTVCAIVAQSCYIDRENNRYGIGRDMRSPQDEFNKRRQKLLHELNSRQVQAQNSEAALGVAVGYDADTVRQEAARPDGVLPPGWGVVPRTDIVSGQFNLLGLAESEMDREGPNPAILGRQGENSSGRAQQVRQQAGLTEQAVIFGGIESWELRVYRAMWNRCRQFWTAPDYIRVTDDEGSAQFIGINQPVQGSPQVVMGPGGVPMIQPAILGYENALAELDVDITLDTIPDTANLAQEQFQILGELAQSGALPPGAIPPEMWIELSSLPNKRQLLEKLEKRQAEQQQNPQAQMAQQIQMRGAVAEVAKTEAQAQLVQAQAQSEMAELGQGEMGPTTVDLNKTVADTRLVEAKTVTEVVKARNEAMRPAIEAQQRQQDQAIQADSRRQA